MGRYTMLLDWKHIVKMVILPKAVYRFKAIPIEIQEIQVFHRTKITSLVSSVG